MGFRFLTESFIDPDTNLITFIPSSERSPDFLAENVLNKQRRSKAWRTDGQFIVETGKNVLVFRENGVTDLNAAVVVGTYSSISAYSLAVKTALQAASTNSVTYTVTQSGLKFVITSNGNGGATLQLRLTAGASLDQADMMGFSTAADLTGSLTYTADAIRIHSEESIVFDLGIASNPTDAVLIGPDRNDPIPFSPGALIKLQGSPTNNFTGTPPIDITITYNDEALFTRSDAGLDPTAVGARFWRWYFKDRENPKGTLQIGAIFIGDHMFAQYANPRTAPQRPFNIKPIDPSDLIFAEGGQAYGDVKPKSEEFGVTIFFKRDEYEELSDAFRRLGTTVPFFIHFDPTAVIGTSANRLLRYVQFREAPEIVARTYDHFVVECRFREAL